MTEEHHLETLVRYEAPQRPARPAAAGADGCRPPRDAEPAAGQVDDQEVARLLNTLLEAYDGRRPAPQVRTLVAPAVYAGLSGPRPPRPRHRTGSVHTCSPADGVIEACARVEAAGRAFALAARFHRGRTGWKCVRFALLDPQPAHGSVRGSVRGRVQRPAAA